MKCVVRFTGYYISVAYDGDKIAVMLIFCRRIWGQVVFLIESAVLKEQRNICYERETGWKISQLRKCQLSIWSDLAFRFNTSAFKGL